MVTVNKSKIWKEAKLKISPVVKMGKKLLGTFPKPWEEKLTVFSLLAIILILIGTPLAFAEGAEEGEEVVIHYFYVEGCSTCANQEEFMAENLAVEYPQIKIKKYDISEEHSQAILENLAENHGVEDLKIIAPMTFINGEFFQGFDEIKGERMKNVIKGENIDEGEFLELPFIGRIRPEDFSLPLLAVAVGSVDGLNVCSIGALVMVLMIVISFDSRGKIFFYGFLFILTVTLVYGLLIFFWYQLLDTVIQNIGLLRYIIGGAGIIGGAFFFKQFVEYYKQGPACEYSEAGFVTKARMKVREAFESTNTGPFILIGSVIFFATVITLIELPCSAALPLAFSGVLVDAQLSGITYMFYVGLYLFFYMVDELVIFAGAVMTKEIWFESSKFITWITLAGSLLLFILGFSYLFGIGIV